MNAFGLARIGRDAEIRYTPDGTAVANISLAFNWGRKNEEGQRPTQWVDGSLWGKQAEGLSQYLLKGTSIFVALSDVHISEFKSGGETKSKLAARIDSVEFAGPKPAAASPAKPAPKPAAKADASFSDMDGDVPF